MGLFDLFRRRGVYERRVQIVTANVLGQGVERLYREQPALRAVVSYLADNVSSLPLKVYDRASDTDRQRVTDGVLPELLAHPNDHTTPQQLWSGTAYDVLLYDSALWYLCESVTSPSGWESTRIPWSWLVEEVTEDGFAPSAFVVQNPDTGRAPVRISADRCILFRMYDPMGPTHASSRVTALKQVLAEQVSAWEFRNAVWKNGGRVSQFLTRPIGAPDWDRNGGRIRFAKSWKARFSGKDGTDTGGTPLLEDGMELKSVTFNAREAQWQEATRLTREDVAAVYHVNPSLIWHTDGQTYASAKDNARALYSETLAPMLNMLENTINTYLPKIVGAPPTQYMEFDLDAKLAGSFEERASVMQSAVGGPWMTRNEARAKLNLPAIEGADELIVPLNVTEGGLASPNDTDPTVERYNAGGPSSKGEPSVVEYKSAASAKQSHMDEIADCLTRFSERQARRVAQDYVTSNVGKDGEPSTKADDDEYPLWWNAARWNKELADDLEPLFRIVADSRGMEAMADIGMMPSAWDANRVRNFVRAMAELRAKLFNETAYEQFVGNLTHFDEGDATSMGEVERLFLAHLEGRVQRGAQTFATAVAGFATKEAARQAYPSDTDEVRRTKTWRHHGSKQPRAAHVAMDGETVGLDEKFSNGADYPGDLGLSAEEASNCHCTMDVSIRKPK